MLLIPDLLTNGGMLPQLANIMGKKKFWVKKTGVFLSLFWVFVCWFLLTPLCGIVDFEEGAAFFAIAGFFGGIAGLAASLFFLPSSNAPAHASPHLNQQRHMPPPHQQYGQLPPQQSIPADSYIRPGNWRDTNELAQPPSVTDNTTKLLSKDDDI
jgi:hypothetical protein